MNIDKLDIEIGAGLKGRFQITRRKADTLEVVEESPWFDNVILDQGLDRLGTSIIASFAKVGTSNTTPTTIQTVLLGYVAATNTIQASSSSAQAVAPYFGRAIRTFRFAAGAAAGTLAEVGVGWATGNAANTLFCRALILDLVGNPTTITVLADEVLDVTYELRIYPDLVDKVFVANISGTDHNCILRAADVVNASWWGSQLFNGFNYGTWPAAYNGALGGITTLPSGLSALPTGLAPVVSAYVPGSYSRVYTPTWGLNDGNLAGGITAWYMPSHVGAFKMSFSPPIDKTNVRTLSLSTKFTWARYTP